MKTTLSLASLASVWIGAAVTVVGLAGCGSNAEATASAMTNAVALNQPAHPCHSPDAMSTQKGCRPFTVTVGTK